MTKNLNSFNFIFPDFLNRIAVESGNGLTRIYEINVNKFLNSIAKGREKYGWLSTSEQVFKKQVSELKTTKAINTLYWRDMARSLEAYSVLSQWRAAELIEASAKLLIEEHVLAPAIISRAIIELATLFIINGGQIRNCITDGSTEFKKEKIILSPDLELLINRAHYGSRTVDKKHALHQTNILTYIEKLSKNPGFEPVREIYAELCEVAHPNFYGNARFWSNIVGINPDGSELRVLQRKPASSNAINQILMNVLWVLSWSSVNIQQGALIIGEQVKTLLNIFPETK